MQKYSVTLKVLQSKFQHEKESSSFINVFYSDNMQSISW